MKSVDPHRHCLQSFLKAVRLGVIEPTAQFMPKEGSQVAATIDRYLGF